MILNMKKLSPYFTAALIACTMAEAAQAQAEPQRSAAHSPTPAEKYGIPYNEAQPARITGWRDVFRIDANKPEVAAKTAQAMDRIFSVPAIRSALLSSVAKKREAASCIENGCDPIFNEQDRADIPRAVYTKTRLSVTDNPLSDVGVNGVTRMTYYKDGNRRTFYLNGTITATTDPQSEYLGRDGKYHSRTLLFDLTHELAHYIHEDRGEDITTARANRWLSAIDKKIPHRGDYHFTRAEAGSQLCRQFHPGMVPIMSTIMESFLKSQEPTDHMPVMHNAHGERLGRAGIANRLSEIYFSTCPTASKI